MLHVNLVRLVARKRRIQPVQDTGGAHRLEFVPVEKVARRTLFAEEKPVPPLRPRGLPILQIRAERSDARAGADHDDGDISVLRQAEALRRMDEHGRALLRPLGEIRAGDAFALPPVALINDRRHREMHLLGKRLLAGSDGIEPRLEFPQQLYELSRGEPDGMVSLEKVDIFHAPEILLQVRLPKRVEHFAEEQARIPGPLRHGLDELLGRLGYLVIAQQRFAETLRGAVVARNALLARATQRIEDVLDERGIIGRQDAERVAHFVSQSRAFERKLVMPRVLLRAFESQLAIDQQRGRERVFPGIKRHGENNTVAACIGASKPGASPFFLARTSASISTPAPLSL